MPSINGVWYPARRLPIPATTVGQNLIGRGCIVVGWSFAETTAAANATFQLLDGNDTGGIDGVDFTLLPNESVRDFWDGDAVYFEMGPFLNMISGSIRGALWYVDVPLSNFSGQRQGA